MQDDNEILREIGQEIRHSRRLLKMSAREFAEITGLTVDMIRRLEWNMCPDLNFDTFVDVRRALTREMSKDSEQPR